MNQEIGMKNGSIIGAQLATLFGIIIVLVITGCIAGQQVFSSTEPFSPLGFASNCPPTGAPLPDRSRIKIKDCGPGCYLQTENESANQEQFHDAEPGNCTTDRIPDFQKQLPIGHLSTMGSPLTGQASCTSNINGVQKLASSNPYGELVKKYGTDRKVNQFTQSYAACEFGTNNIFDKDMLKY